MIIKRWLKNCNKECGLWEADGNTVINWKCSKEFSAVYNWDCLPGWNGPYTGGRLVFWIAACVYLCEFPHVVFRKLDSSEQQTDSGLRSKETEGDSRRGKRKMMGRRRHSIAGEWFQQFQRLHLGTGAQSDTVPCPWKSLVSLSQTHQRLGWSVSYRNRRRTHFWDYSLAFFVARLTQIWPKLASEESISEPSNTIAISSNLSILFCWSSVVYYSILYNS